ncbi:M1 family metallopeptidase [Methyloversatilis thermotolerans]|uniref:M1 family metallopeptidase n=1 Tax=Methyloversatilis thermotolerans TaxID=1346290 RepID=UPI000364E467|nr:M1 family aminopeptidase [Methyloversatilis thermotolerans]
MTTVRVGLALLLAASCARAAPGCDIELSLDPATHSARAHGRFMLAAGEGVALRMDARHPIHTLEVDGRPHATTARDGLWQIDLTPAPGPRTLTLKWTLTGDAMASGQRHRDTLTDFALRIDETGSFLPAQAGWYPLPMDGERVALHRCSVRIDLPAGQRAVSTGERVSEQLDGARRRLVWQQEADGEGLDVMAGPWQETLRSVRSIDGRNIELATLFPAALAGEAAGYLDAAADALARYEARIGAYPYRRFTIAASPTPTGFGMAGLTYLGSEVLRLPFIRHTSLPHEVLHNWWGNGVYVDPDSGNWSEGLTTFMADYAQREAQGEDAARAMRLDWLRGLSALPDASQGTLAAFRGRTHDASQAVGYHKAALVFLMLRDELGEEAFARALRDFWQQQRFRRASWTTLQDSFERSSGRKLGALFEQWIRRAGLPALSLHDLRAQPGAVTLTLRQAGPAYALTVPLALRDTGDGSTRIEKIALRGTDTSVQLGLTRCADIALDPDFRLARRLAAGEAPPILREATLDPALTVTVLDDGDTRLRAAAEGLLDDWLDRRPPRPGADSPPGSEARLVVGSTAALDRWLRRHNLPARPHDGEVVAWAMRAPQGGVLALVAARDADALAAARRGLPHYGQQGWVVLRGGRAVERGQWPAAPRWTRICPANAPAALSAR